MKTFTRIAVAATLGAVMGTTAMAEGLYAPNLAYRTGPFAATGIPLMNGQADYMNMLNARDGGIGGVMIDFDECETGYSTEKGVECYEKTKGKAIVTQPWSTGITLQVLPKSNIDEIPILAPGYGFSPMADGKVFQWAFNTPLSYWDGASIILKYLQDQGDLSGKKIAFLHLDHPFGKEPLPYLEQKAEAQGFELVPIPVGLKEMQNQSAQWLQIRRERPDYVIMWGWGAMNAGAITEAVKTKFPMENMLGVWWSGHDADLKIVGEDGKGYKSVSWSFPNPDAPVMADVKQHVVDAGNSQSNEEEMQGVFYSRGLVISAILAEGIAVAQEHTGKAEISPADLRWGLENLNFTEERLEELGMTGMVPPFSTSCSNHTGHSGGWILEWDGAKFVKASDLIMPDSEAISELEMAKAQEYAEANAPWPVNEDCEM
ncbi:ABC transporter substrate-binding protein [Salipiger bermudensis]|uniref:ABC branched amino acid transporter family, periplasmic substrate-binding subunit n=1 Tax=Salipiger bermudensis (strain DSM 26914 / JCM 13377 / KCTC 12554 / HTCC2601) TaxID=314265 RepID=Q0FJY9_SALBH|nr:ABC transporter substrate-binding protein [Salipiger bermudensis]EAU44537.1 ABC branched amino acid transporter family, periplasmic substrate-binding subunit [Salipiger bermudensis HTCC2601]MBR9892305.1 ABC transporter substrate-binding protein [bacterium]MCA1285459.1 ABC transporter substrate-binding protein [Salipiger bermudensis]